MRDKFVDNKENITKDLIEEIIPEDCSYFTILDFIITASFCSDIIRFIEANKDNSVTKSMVVQLIKNL